MYKIVNRSASPTTVKSSSATSSTYGTHYPNRVFAGYLPGKVTASDLADFFSSYGVVLEGKIVLDSLGRSRRFGFITFASPDGVKNVLSQESIYYNGKRINVGPAVKKMSPDDITPPPSPNGSDKSVDLSTMCIQNNLSRETIITVPPVNGKKEERDVTGNVWTKIINETEPMKEKIQKQVCNDIQPYYQNNLHQQNPYPGIYFYNQPYTSTPPLLNIIPYHSNYVNPVMNVSRPFIL